MHHSWKHSLLLGEKNEAEQPNAREKSERQPVDKYGGGVRSVAEHGAVPVTEAFVKQVVEKIHKIIEAKLFPIQLLPVPTIQSAHPGPNYQANLFFSDPYNDVSAPQVGFQVASAPQVGCSTA